MIDGNGREYNDTAAAAYDIISSQFTPTKIIGSTTTNCKYDNYLQQQQQEYKYYFNQQHYQHKQQQRQQQQLLLFVVIILI